MRGAQRALGLASLKLGTKDAEVPQGVATLVKDAITWVQSNPSLRLEPAPTPPLVLIESWNRFGEGSHLIPNTGDGTSYGDAIAAMLLSP